MIKRKMYFMRDTTMSFNKNLIPPCLCYLNII